jgi:acyl-CoA thioesterase FadM
MTLSVTYRDTVAPEHIDELGHMNVRIYGLFATRAGRHMLDEAGLVEDDTACLVTVDTYTRHHREQHVGAPVAVRSGVLSVDENHAQIYHELFNEDTDVLAATFVRRVERHERTQRTQLPISEAAVGALARQHTELPAHGEPRSLTLLPLPPAPSIDDLLARGLASRAPRVVPEDLVDEQGFLRSDSYQDLIWGGEPVDTGDFEWIRTGDNGERVGMASMETRATLHHMPKLGTPIQSFGAEVDLREKTSNRRQWVYDLDSGAVVCTVSSVNLAFDLDTRRSIPIPATMRRQFENMLLV